MSHTILLYHAGYQEIKCPEIHYGRKNADFGQGFYTTKDPEFARRWARERKGSSPCVNTYQLGLTGLKTYCFKRDEAWFDYITSNRAGRPDTIPDADIVIGPIANDTLYDTLGIITSGLLEREQALRLLLIGPAYEQTVLKTEKAAAQLKWLSCRRLESPEMAKYRQLAAREEADYQKAVSEVLETDDGIHCRCPL